MPDMQPDMQPKVRQPIGICTLGNDVVFDQVVALLNSIEAQAGPSMPVCIYPYDDRLDRLRAEVATRPQVSIYGDQGDEQDSIATWDQWVRDCWDACPGARSRWQAAGCETGYYRVGTHRRFAAFDGPFDRFIYMDADTLLLRSPEALFARLDDVDFLVYDFQFSDLSHVYDDGDRLRNRFGDRLSEIFCSGFYGAKGGQFNPEVRAQLLSQLRLGDGELLYPMAPDQTLLNYMVMAGGLRATNLAQTLPAEQITGCCITSDHFKPAIDSAHNPVLRDRDQPLTYLHYIGLSSKIIAQVCCGENLDFPYRDLFLHYRYLHQPERRPVLTGSPRVYREPRSIVDRIRGRLAAFV
jgi:hypothetical protein